MITENSYFKVPTILITIMIFFGHLVPVLNYYHMQIIILFVTVIIALLNNGKLIIRQNILWVIFILLAIISLMYSCDFSLTIRFIFMIGAVVLVKVIYESKSGWQTYFERCFFIASFIHVIATLMQFVFPNFITRFNSVILKQADYFVNIQMLNIGNYAGITGQTGVNALFISIFIAIVVCRLLCNHKKNILLYFLWSMGLIALFLTVKRSQIIINIIAILIVSSIFNKRNRKYNNASILFVVIGIAYLILVNIPATMAVFEKFSLFSESADFTNGRKELWNLTFDIFKNNPCFGVGAGSIEFYLQGMTHNIYIQLLAEMGVVGLVSFICAIGLSLTNTVKISKSMVDAKISSKAKNTVALSVYFQVYFILYGFSGNPLYGVFFFGAYMQMIAIANAYYNEIKYK